jgi:hypothetical protein
VTPLSRIYTAGFVGLLASIAFLDKYAYPHAQMTHSTAFILYTVAAGGIVAFGAASIAFANPLRSGESLARALSFVLILLSVAALALCVVGAATLNPDLRRWAILALAPGISYVVICLGGLLFSTP